MSQSYGTISAFLSIVMNIEEINRKHYITQDIYYRVGFGLSSKLLRFDKGIIYLEMEVRKKWDKSYNAAVYEIAHCWKKEHAEFASAVACKVYIIDSKKFPYKRTLMHLGIKPGYDGVKGILYDSKKFN